jgi:putative copper export protein
MISLWVHVPFIIAWIGLVMLDVVALFAPGLERAQRARLLLWSRPFVLLAIAVILVTGIWQTIENPFYRVESWSGLSELKKRSLYGDLLFWKHVFVIATFGLTLITRFFLAPRIRNESDGTVVTSGGALAMASRTSALSLTKLASLANVGACLGAVLLATRMVFELH